ncbi:MAG TPA: response regulator [Azospira sp.]|nr:response regulator [Azospira sp.]
MSASDDKSLQRLIERVRALAAQQLLALDTPVPALLRSTLVDFNIATKENHCLEDAGETARSLAVLLHHCGERAPNDQERPQVSLLIGNLLRELAPVGSTLPEMLPPLVTPIVPSAASAQKRVALYVDSGALLVMLHETLSQAGFQPVTVDSLESFAFFDEGQRPVAIIADLGLCQLHPQCSEVFSTLRQRFDPPPHLFCIGAAADIPARLEAVRLGATRFLAQPIDTGRLVAVLKGVTLQTPPQPFRALLVEDDPFLGEVFAGGLRDEGLEVCVVDDPLQAPIRIAEFDPDVIVSDIYMPGCNGFELLAMLRQDDALADTPIMVLSSEPQVGRRMEALALGADDFLSKPVEIELLVSAVIARARRARMLKRSRSEYRRVLQRLRELEPHLPEQLQGSTVSEMDFDDLFPEAINLDDYVVREVHHEDLDNPGDPEPRR